LLFIEDTTVTVKCRAAIKALFLYFNVCPSTMSDSRSRFIYSHILSYYKLCLYFKLCLSVMLDSSSMFIYIHILSYYKLCLYFKLYLSVLLDSSSLFIYIHILSYYSAYYAFHHLLLGIMPLQWLAWLIYWFIDWCLKTPTLAMKWVAT
jgi:hypothetical protein